MPKDLHNHIAAKFPNVSKKERHRIEAMVVHGFLSGFHGDDPSVTEDAAAAALINYTSDGYKEYKSGMKD